MLRAPDIGIELGNSKFAICVKGEGIVATEASYVAFRGAYLDESSIVAFGNEARVMAEHNHPGIQVVTPMSEGIVKDSRLAGLLLKKIAKKAGLKPIFLRPKAVVAALFGASEVERRAFVDVATSIAPRQCCVIDEPLAAAHAIPAINIMAPRAQLILDVGDGATEAMIVSMGRSVLGRSMRFGGADVEHMLIAAIKKHHGLLISRNEAKRIKEKLSTGYDKQEPWQTLSVKGLALDQFLPREVDVAETVLRPIIEKVEKTIGGFILDILECAPPDISGDLFESGIFLCGGGSHMAGIRSAIETYTNLPVHSCGIPDQTVIQGIHRILATKP